MTGITLDVRDIVRFKDTCAILGQDVAVKAARKGAQKGSLELGKELRKKAPEGETGQLRKGFRRKKERSRLQGKFVYEYSLNPSMNKIFQKKPIKNPGILGGKNEEAYYPASVEYGFLARAPGAGYTYTPGTKIPTQKVEGQHYTSKAVKAAEPKAIRIISDTFNKELDKAWHKK